MTHGDLLCAQPVDCDIHVEAARCFRSRAPVKPQKSLTWGLTAIARTEKLKDSEIKACVRWQQRVAAWARRSMGAQWLGDHQWGLWFGFEDA